MYVGSTPTRRLAGILLLHTTMTDAGDGTTETHHVNESADKVVLTTKIKRGIGGL